MKGFRAEATVYICRVVTAVGASNNFGLLVPADGSVLPLGISGSSMKYPPIENLVSSSLDDVHAESGDPVVVHSANDGDVDNSTVLGWLGGSVTRGTALMAAGDGSGKLITATSTNYVVAVADMSGSANQIIPVTPVSPYKL